MTTPPRRLTPAERRRQIDAFLASLAARGIVAREFFDASGRSYIAVELDPTQPVSAELAQLFAELAAQSPLPQLHTPPAA